MIRLLRELAGYGAASLAALCVDMAVLWILVSWCGLDYIVAACISFLTGAVVAYWLSVRIAFRQHRMGDRRAEFLCFLAIGTAGLGINACVIYVAVQMLAIHYLLAKAIAAGFTFSFNFLARRQMFFVRPQQAFPPQP